MILLAAKNTGDALCNLMNMNVNLPPRATGSYSDYPSLMQPARTTLTKAVKELVGCLEKLPIEKKPEPVGAELQTVDISDDVEAFAENELLKCAKMIADAAASLMQVNAVKKTSVSVGLDMSDINEAILEAARAIAGASGNLITCAAVSQAERKEEARSGTSKYFADPAWASGLVSVAQKVAAQIGDLVVAANNSASGQSDEERLIACARAVGATTIALVTASRTKADPSSQSQRNLSNASVAVTTATQQLVVAAKAASDLNEAAEEEDFSLVNFAQASGIRAQMEQRTRIAKLEKELAAARQELLTLRRSRYQKG